MINWKTKWSKYTLTQTHTHIIFIYIYIYICNTRTHPPSMVVIAVLVMAEAVMSGVDMPGVVMLQAVIAGVVTTGVWGGHSWGSHDGSGHVEGSRSWALEARKSPSAYKWRERDAALWDFTAHYYISVTTIDAICKYSTVTSVHVERVSWVCDGLSKKTLNVYSNPQLLHPSCYDPHSITFKATFWGHCPLPSSLLYCSWIISLPLYLLLRLFFFSGVFPCFWVMLLTIC